MHSECTGFNFRCIGISICRPLFETDNFHFSINHTKPCALQCRQIISTLEIFRRSNKEIHSDPQQQQQRGRRRWRQWRRRRTKRKGMWNTKMTCCVSKNMRWLVHLSFQSMLWTGCSLGWLFKYRLLLFHTSETSTENIPFCSSYKSYLRLKCEAVHVFFTHFVSVNCK